MRAQLGHVALLVRAGGEAALDALHKGFRVTVDPAAVRGVDVEPGDAERALEELREAGATVG